MNNLKRFGDPPKKVGKFGKSVLNRVSKHKTLDASGMGAAEEHTASVGAAEAITNMSAELRSLKALLVQVGSTVTSLESRMSLLAKSQAHSDSESAASSHNTTLKGPPEGQSLCA